MKILSRLTGVVCLGPLVLPLLSGQVFGWTDSLCTGDALGQQKKPADKPPAADIKKFLQRFSQPIRIRESEPVAANGVKFVVVAQTNWNRPEQDELFQGIAPLEIQLQITNLKQNAVLFPTFKTFGVRVLNADGKEVKPRGNLGGDISTKPILLPGGATYSICRRAELQREEKSETVDLVYYDGTGAQTIIGPLRAGRYKLVFWCRVSADEQQKHRNSDAPVWGGEIVTNEVSINVINDTTRGVDFGEQDLRASAEPLRIRESKPLTVNEAKFVVIAETSWKPKKNVEAAKSVISRGVPIEIQLRITNLSKRDLAFPTFDTFRLAVFRADGERIRPGGGRAATVFPGPILLAAGTSYSLGTEGVPHGVRRRAELLWDEKSKAAVLVYFNGTGRADYFGPLRPGQYNLAFVFAVSGAGTFDTESNPAIWLGNATTERVTIEVVAP